MTIRREIAFKKMFRVSSFKFLEEASGQPKTRNQKPATRMTRRAQEQRIGDCSRSVRE
jgi:hypothetical protein